MALKTAAELRAEIRRLRTPTTFRDTQQWKETLGHLVDCVMGEPEPVGQAPAPTEQPQAVQAPAPTEQQQAVQTPAPTEQPQAVQTPAPTEQQQAVQTPAPTEQPPAVQTDSAEQQPGVQAPTDFFAA